jgi:hypothetical protein
MQLPTFPAFIFRHCNAYNSYWNSLRVKISTSLRVAIGRAVRDVRVRTAERGWLVQLRQQPNRVIEAPSIRGDLIAFHHSFDGQIAIETGVVHRRDSKAVVDFALGERDANEYGVPVLGDMDPL